jgi:hypothetical protein
VLLEVKDFKVFKEVLQVLKELKGVRDFKVE